MWKQLGAAALVAAIVAPAVQAEGLVRVRALEILPNTKSHPVGGVNVGNKLAPDVDLSWFFSKNFAAELVLTYPQSHHVTLNGTDLGRASHLPPTLLAQYHLPLHGFTPYAGAGVNYTIFTDRRLDLGGTPLKLDRDSVGPALQLGVDVPLQGNWSLNADFKKIWIKSDVRTYSGAYVTSVDINPFVVGLGVGYRFR